MNNRSIVVVASILGVAIGLCNWLFPFHPIGPSPLAKLEVSSSPLPREQAGIKGINKTFETAKLEMEAPRQSELFPIYGVTLGKTTVSELKKLGEKHKNFDCYEIQGTHFWYHHDVADDMSLTKYSKVPERWKGLGFDWGLSYNELTELFKKLGYSVIVSKSPMIKEFNGHRSFYAELDAAKLKGLPIRIKFEFKYSKGTTTDSKGTLYCMTIKSL